jgi:quercetin dioxygenase-like cupin family protein
MPTMKWMLGAIAGQALAISAAWATPASNPGFSGTFVKGTFAEFSVRAQLFPEGFGGTETDLWFSMQKTKGPSDVYVVSNVWAPGATTGWHSHPGYSLIIVTKGTITAYDEETCEPHTYSAGDSATLIDANHVHMIKNETSEEARATAVQIVPEGVGRRIDVPADQVPSGCPLN